MGEIELALADIATGQVNTWGQYLERAYVLGRIAIDNGDTEYGLEMLQLAEATLDNYTQPRLYEQTLEEIARIGGAPLYPTPTPNSEPTPTPIEPIPDQLYFTPTPPAQNIKFTPVNYFGTGLHYFDKHSINFVFRPSSILRVERVKSLIINVKADYSTKDFTLQYDCVAANGSWGSPSTPINYSDLAIGENEISDPQRCVGADGNIYIAFMNAGEEPIVVENISLRLVAINDDGSEVIYGDQ